MSVLRYKYAEGDASVDIPAVVAVQTMTAGIFMMKGDKFDMPSNTSSLNESLSYSGARPA